MTNEWATPGYLPGRVDGPWQVVLGLYRVAPGGVDVSIDITTPNQMPRRPTPPPLPPRPQRPPRRELPAAAGHEWLAGDFHSHTVHSDGSLEIVELAALAAGRGLDLLAVTDHNTVSHHAHLPAAGDHAGILLVPGQEVTTDVGHANCFGDIGWVDFRDPPDVWQARATERGGLMAVNHPWAWDCAWRMPLTQPADLVEMWHWTWDRRDSDGAHRLALVRAAGNRRQRLPPPGLRRRARRRRRPGWSAPSAPSTPCSTRCATAGSRSAPRRTDRC